MIAEPEHADIIIPTGVLRIDRPKLFRTPFELSPDWLAKAFDRYHAAPHIKTNMR